MKMRFWKHASGPSLEAVKARAQAGVISDRADEVYSDRERLLARNQFADRIRLIYEGR